MRLAKRSIGSRIATMAAFVAVGCFTFAFTPDAQAKGGKDKDHKVHGKVASITTGSSGTATITIDVHHHKKGEANPQVSEQRTFTITTATKIERREKDGTTVPATLADVKTGKHVSLEVKDKDVLVLKIGHHHHHHKKPAPTA
jgi:hypothetical protein